MIYPETFEVKLGFDQIRAKLKNYCLSSAGQSWVDTSNLQYGCFNS